VTEREPKAVDCYLWLHTRTDGKTADIFAGGETDGETTGAGGSSHSSSGVPLRVRGRKRGLSALRV